MSKNPFEIDPTNYFGGDYEDHISKCTSLALSNPVNFNDARASIIRILKRDLTKNFFTNIQKFINKITGFKKKVL